MSQLSRRSRDLLQSARAAAPTAQARGRMDARLAAKLGVAALGAGAVGAGAVLAAGSTAASSTTAGATAAGSTTAALLAHPAGTAIAMGFTAKAVLAGVFVVGVGAAGGFVAHSRSAPTESSRTESRAASVDDRNTTVESNRRGEARAPSAERPEPTSELALLEPGSMASATAEAPPQSTLPLAPITDTHPVAKLESADRQSSDHDAALARAALPKEALLKEALSKEGRPTGASPTGAHPVDMSAKKHPDSGLDDQTDALRAAQLALQHDPARAIVLLDDLAKRHPDGTLREDRMAARVLALCAANRVDEARVAGRAFLQELPSSMHADRIRASCAFTTKSPE